MSVIGGMTAALLLVLLAPLMAVLALAVAIDTRCSPFFRQQRVGQHASVFTIYKIRTMTGHCDTGQLLPDEQRLTSLGRFLRRTSLDELPQLWNIACGDMAFVGPRPLPPAYLPRYNTLQRRRHEVKPGITGWAQVNGRNALTWEQKFELDVWYVDHKSLALDLKILWRTLLTVLRRQGIRHGSHASMPEFLGSIERTTKP